MKLEVEWEHGKDLVGVIFIDRHNKFLRVQTDFAGLLRSLISDMWSIEDSVLLKNDLGLLSGRPHR
ncbi:MAG: hypothetical protein JST58_06360 [Bacteroidetes bacterium]|nr:hypothetical protein [Bacteroidota bacterium]